MFLSSRLRRLNNIWKEGKGASNKELGYTGQTPAQSWDDTYASLFISLISSYGSLSALQVTHASFHSSVSSEKGLAVFSVKTPTLLCNDFS